MNKMSAKHYIMFVFAVTIISLQTYSSVFITIGGRETWICTIIAFILLFLFALAIIHMAYKGNTYDIKYGVGVIVSGTLPFFDIDFMNPMEDQTITNETEDTYDAKAFLAIYGKIKDEISREIDYTGEHYSEWQDSCSDPNVREDPVLQNIVTEEQMQALSGTEVCTLQNKINQIEKVVKQINLI